MKTKITMLNGEKFILDGDPQKIMNELRNGNGVVAVKTVDAGPITIDPYNIITLENVND